MLKVYNTLTKKKEIFEPREDKKVNMFVCGPTVYDFPHIGHAKTYVQFDFIVKYLRYKGYDVFYLQNITDIDDKIIQRAEEEKTSFEEIVRKFEKIYYEDMNALHCNSVTKYARATDFIKQIVEQVKRLIEKGYAYKLEDGYYFDVSKFKEYGKLSRRTWQEAEDAISRIDESKGKRNKADFCLWKFSKPNEPAWETEIGKGRPGWHIEDTAITEHFFGPQYDVHGGARDLIFPHHEAEIAQQEAASGKKPFVKYWLHTGFLTINGKKMSKSLKNFITIRDALKKYNYKVLRFFFLSHHYRSPIDFSYENVIKAKKALERINNFALEAKGRKDVCIELLEEMKKEFFNALDDDFNIPKALAILFDFIHNAYKKGFGNSCYLFIKEINKFFDCFSLQEIEIPREILELVEKREKARRQGNFELADKIRGEIKSKGYWIDDTPKGPKIRKLES